MPTSTHLDKLRHRDVPLRVPMETILPPDATAPSSTCRRSNRRPLVVGVAVLLLAASFAAAVALSAPFRRQVMLSVSERPARYTELYFTDPTTLPQAVVSGRTYPLRYTIVNHTGRTQSYPVSIFVRHGQDTQALSPAPVEVASGRKADATAGLFLSAPKSTYSITIRLPSGQQIQWSVRTV